MAVLRLITAPALEPVTVDDVRLHCRLTEMDEIDGGSPAALIEESYLNSLILTARQTVEQYCGPLITQGWEQYEQDWPDGDRLHLWKPRVLAVSGVTYTDSDSVTATLDTDYYTADVINEFRPAVVLNYNYSWPVVTMHPVNPVKITFTAGYGASAENVPEPLRQAMLLLIAHLYENREPYNISISGNSVVPIPWSVDALMAPYRAWGFEA